MGTKRWVRRLAGVAFGTALAGAPVLSPRASAAPLPPPESPTVKLGAATLVAGGAALTVQVTISCPKSPTPIPGAVSGVSVDVTQALGAEATTAGAGGSPISCDGTAHDLPMDVTVFAPMAPFKAGVAFAHAGIFVDCTPESCTQASQSGEMTITAAAATP